MNMKISVFALLMASAMASATAVADNQKTIDAKADSALAKRGVEIGGSIRAVAQRSNFDTDQDPAGLNQMPDVERNEFVSADIDFRFRPYENVRANVMMRLGGGMQEYFAAASKTLAVEWINVEGNVGNSFYWVAGDFRQQYSPLTLFLPSIDIMYEPLIFARKRHMAQKQQLIEGNQRNLQGVNLQFRKELDPMLGEVRAEALLARVNRSSVLDFTGAEGNIMTNENLPGATLASNMDKWLAAGNLELLPLSKNVYVGLTPMYIFDNEKSYSYTYRHPEKNLGTPYERESINPFDVDAQETMVVSGRLGADVSSILGQKNLIADVVGEYAMSNDKVYTHVSTQNGTNEDGEPIFVDNATDEKLTGAAILATMNVGYKTDSWSAVLTVNGVRNDSNWFNNLAQSPSFFAQRILNSDKDGNVVKYGSHAPLYSSFDALYNFAPKFSPVARSLGTDDNAFKGGQSNSYNIAPYNKNSWGTNVYTRSQLALLETLNDPTLQLALPNGLATSNRLGAQAVGVFGWKDYAEVQGLFTMLQQVNPVLGFEKVAYTEYGGGAKLDVFKLIGFSKPLEISGSYKHSERKADLDAAVVGASGTGEFKSDFINAGLYVQFLPRLGFAAGFQMINSEYNDVGADYSWSDAPLMKGKQMQWMAGFDYTVAENAWLSINFGMVNVENEYNTASLVAAGSGGAVNLPDYYTVASDPAGSFKSKFSQTIMEASINVEF